MKYFTGIDVSLRFVSICVVDEAGVVQACRDSASHVARQYALPCRTHRGGRMSRCAAHC